MATGPAWGRRPIFCPRIVRTSAASVRCRRRRLRRHHSTRATRVTPHEEADVPANPRFRPRRPSSPAPRQHRFPTTESEPDRLDHGVCRHRRRLRGGGRRRELPGCRRRGCRRGRRRGCRRRSRQAIRAPRPRLGQWNAPAIAMITIARARFLDTLPVPPTSRRRGRSPDPARVESRRRAPPQSRRSRTGA